MMWSSSIITALSADTNPSFMVTFDHAKYVFNTSENTTRSLKANGRAWRRTKGIFFTQSKLETVGGLPGLIMTFADGTINQLKLMGPAGLNHLVASMRGFTYRDLIDVKTTEIPHTSPAHAPCYSDENISVYPIPLNPVQDTPTIPQKDQDTPTDDTTSYADPDENSKRKREESPTTPRKKTYDSLEATMRSRPFVPSDLTGAMANEYRHALIQKMFPATAKPPLVSTKGAKSLTDVPEPNNAVVDEDQRPKRDILPGMYSQLPKYVPEQPASTISYFIRGPQYRGKFDAAKAKELMIPNGPLRAKLASGETITFDVKVDGEIVSRTVCSEDVVGKPENPGAIAIFDVPSLSHIPPLVSTFQDTELYNVCWSADGLVKPDGDAPYTLRTIYHMCGEDVLENESYKAFMRGFGPDVYHIIASRDHCANHVSFGGAAQNQLYLNQVDPKIFPVPKHTNVPKKDMKLIPGLPDKVQPMTYNLQSGLRPWTPPTPTAVVAARDKFTPITSGAVPFQMTPSLESAISTAHRNINEIIQSGRAQEIEGADIGVVALGTGGSMPTHFRNVLSTLIKIPGYGNLLLDAGEGTWGQLARNFGLEKDEPGNAWDVLRDIKCIFISHIHGDHHIGLANLLAKRRELDPPPKEPLYIVSVRATLLYLREMNDVQDLGIDDPSGNGVISITSESLHHHNGPYATSGMWRIGGNEPWLDIDESRANARKMCDALGLEYFKTVDVNHGCRCFGCTFKHRDGWSITFSGDTGPSQSLCEAGHNSTLLIHEATMCDDELSLAQAKAHSTVGQAVERGRLMNAKAIMLTHFSARYPRFPPRVTDSVPSRRRIFGYNTTDPSMVVAFDHMNLTIGDMWKMQFYNPCIMQVFRDTYDETLEDDDSAADMSPPRARVFQQNARPGSPSRNMRHSSPRN